MRCLENVEETRRVMRYSGAAPGRRHLLTICYARATHASPDNGFRARFGGIAARNIITRSVGRTSWRSMMTNGFKGGGSDDFRSRDGESPLHPRSFHPVTTLRESMCMGDPAGSGSLAVLTGNTMDPLFGKPRRLPWRPTRDVTTHRCARWNKWRHVLLPPSCSPWPSPPPPPGLSPLTPSAIPSSFCLSFSLSLPLRFHLSRSPQENAVLGVGRHVEAKRVRRETRRTNAVRRNWKNRDLRDIRSADIEKGVGLCPDRYNFLKPWMCTI